MARIKSHARLHWYADRAEWRCIYCGELTFCLTCRYPNVDERQLGRLQSQNLGRATVDHFLPQSKLDGAKQRGNLVLACARCNETKGDMVVPEGSTYADLVRLRKVRDSDPRYIAECRERSRNEYRMRKLRIEKGMVSA